MNLLYNTEVQQEFPEIDSTVLGIACAEFFPRTLAKLSVPLLLAAASGCLYSLALGLQQVITSLRLLLISQPFL